MMTNGLATGKTTLIFSQCCQHILLPVFGCHIPNQCFFSLSTSLISLSTCMNWLAPIAVKTCHQP